MIGLPHSWFWLEPGLSIVMVTPGVVGRGEAISALIFRSGE